MDTNALYQDIQAKKQQMEAATKSLVEKQKSAPQVEANLRQDLMGNDAGLNSLRDQYSDGVLQLYKYDLEKAGNYLPQELQDKGLVADPTVGMNEQYGKFMSTASHNQDVWKELDKRKTVLGDLVKASMDRYNAEMTGDKTLIDAAEKGISIALQQMTEERLTQEQTLRYGEGDGLTGADAVAEVIKQGGSDFVNVGKDMASRSAIAETILKSGGVAKYRESMPLESILNDKELEADKAAAEMLDAVSTNKELFKDNAFMGTGPVGGLTPGFLATEKTRAKRRAAESIKAYYAKLLSGLVVSDREMARLEKFLPTSFKTEKENYGDMITLEARIRKNLELFERAKREGITANQAYIKYSKEYGLDKDGLPIPKTDKDSVILKLKEAGKTEEEINEYLKVKGIN